MFFVYFGDNPSPLHAHANLGRADVLVQPVDPRGADGLYCHLIVDGFPFHCVFHSASSLWTHSRNPAGSRLCVKVLDSSGAVSYQPAKSGVARVGGVDHVAGGADPSEAVVRLGDLDRGALVVDVGVVHSLALAIL